MFAPNARICKPQNLNKGTGDLDFVAGDLSLQFGGITSLEKRQILNYNIIWQMWDDFKFL